MTIPAARHIKIHPVNWNSEICMRVRIYKLVNIGTKGSNSYFILFFILLRFCQVSGRDNATALANYCGPVSARPQHRELRALLFTNSVWAL